ncbi:MAG: hypothetical protein U0O09_02395, partial [Phascolarctobacterium sp.]
MVVKVKHNDKFLAKKVLLSFVAAGVMTGFVMNAEAADISHEDGQKHTYTAVEAGKVTAHKGSEIELNGGKFISIKEKRVDKEDDRVGYADDSAESSGVRSKIVAKNVDFKGEVHASTGGTIILNGGSVTSGTFYYTDNQGAGPIEGYSTEIRSRGEDAYVELNKVKIDSNLGAFKGGVLTVNDSNVNADTAIYAEGGTVNLISTDGKATYTASGEGVEAVDGGVININGGGTLHTSNISVEGNGSKFITDGSVEAQKIVAGSNASVILNGGGKITGYK